MENQFNIIYNKTTGLFSVLIKGIPFTFSRDEMEFLGLLIKTILK